MLESSASNATPIVRWVAIFKPVRKDKINDFVLGQALAQCGARGHQF
jgi:hypothetical protein